VGTSGADAVYLTASVSGAVGDNLSGIESLFGSADGDVLKATTVTYVDGRGGNDSLVGGAGTDTLIGGLGLDTLVGAGTDSLVGGDGNDLYIISANTVKVVEASGEGTDTVSVSGLDLSSLVSLANVEFVAVSGDVSLSGAQVNGLTSVVGTSGADAVYLTASVSGAVGDNLSGIESLFGSADGDVLKATTVTYVDGQGGNDSLVGGAGNDNLIGGSGSDTLSGGAGVDTLTGGTGADADYFVISNDVSRDLVTDFYTATDKLVMDAFTSLSGVSATIDGSVGADVSSFGDATIAANNYFSGADEGVYLAYDSVRAVTYVLIDSNTDGVYDYATEISGDVTMAGTNFTTATGQTISLAAQVASSTAISSFGIDGSRLSFNLAGLSGGSLNYVREGTQVVITAGVVDSVGGYIDLVAKTGGGGNYELGFLQAQPSGGNTRYLVPDLTSFYVTDEDVGNVSNLNTIIGDLTATERTNLSTLYTFGFGGDDTITGLTTISNYIDAGLGNDYVLGGSASDTLLGDDGADTLIGGAGNDVLYGGDGDSLVGGEDSDLFIVANSSASFKVSDAGANGSDTLSVGGSVDLSNADLTGIEYLIVDGAVSMLSSQAARFTSIVGATASLDDIVYLVHGDQSLVGANFSGIESLFGSDWADNLVATNVHYINGGPGDDSIVGNASSADVLIGLDGDDTLVGQSNDTLDAGTNAGTVVGTNGDLVVIEYGSTGFNVTGDALDTLSVGGSVDLTYAGLGTIQYLTTDGDVSLTGTQANAFTSIYGASGSTDDVVYLTSVTGSEVGGNLSGIESLFGSAGDDQLSAANAHYVDGRDGADSLSGSAGDDTLVGGLGADWLDLGADTSGNDHIVYNSAAESTFDSVTGGYDVIDNFDVHNNNFIDLNFLESLPSSQVASSNGTGFLSSPGSLAEALNQLADFAVNNPLPGTTVLVWKFGYGSDTYVYADTHLSDSTYQTGDFLIKLVGVTAGNVGIAGFMGSDVVLLS
jgi:Ca2+-binding RTX toxin-like protein